MKPHHKKVIGIDVCQNSVSVVRLERSADKILLTESRKIPFGKQISFDCHSDFKYLARLIKSLKLTKNLEHCDTAVCFCSSPDLLQMLRLPDSNPHNSIKYIYDEIRQYAVLPLKNRKIDYCSLRSSDGRNVLVGACQTEPLVELAKELGKIQVDIRLIEPAILSLVRACYRKIIGLTKDKNTMLVLVRNDTVNICVFAGQMFDFLRTKKTEPNSTAVSEQIQSVLQYYEFEKNAHQDKWQIFIHGCDIQKNQLQNVEINTITPEHLNIVNQCNAAEFSFAAAGAAMNLLGFNDSGISINMIPDEISEIRKSNKNLLLIVNTAAVILVLLFLHIAQLAIQTSEAKAKIEKQMKIKSEIDIAQLARRQADANEQIRLMTKNIALLSKAMPDNSRINWAYAIAEISKKSPQTVQINKINLKGKNSFSIEGVAVNYAAVSDFINRLSECRTISSAQLADTKQNSQYGNGFMDFSITCAIAQK